MQLPYRPRNPLCNLSGGRVLIKKEFKRNLVGSVSYPPVYGSQNVPQVDSSLESVMQGLHSESLWMVMLCGATSPFDTYNSTYITSKIL